MPYKYVVSSTEDPLGLSQRTKPFSARELFTGLKRIPTSSVAMDENRRPAASAAPIWNADGPYKGIQPAS